METEPLSILPPAPVQLVPHETAATAVAAYAEASVKARFSMALMRPRDMNHVRIRILEDCKRPGFARAARYSKPVGKTPVVGASIRFVEAALRAFGNVYPEVQLLFDDDFKRIVRVCVTDLETNVTYAKELCILKQVERRSVQRGQEVVAQRRNSAGDLTFIVAATEDDLANKQAAAESKAVRTLGLRLLPADIVEEALAACAATLTGEVVADPKAQQRAIADAFASINVSPADLAEYLGVPLGQASPAQIVALRSIYAAISDGESTWRAALMQHTGVVKDPPTGTDKLKEAIKS